MSHESTTHPASTVGHVGTVGTVGTVGHVGTAQTDEYVAPGWVASFLPRRDLSYLAATAALFAAVALALALVAPSAFLLPAFFGLAGFGALISAGDAVTKHIPNRANGLALASAVPLLVLARLSQHGSLWRGLLGALAAFLAYFLLSLISPGSLGMGDVKFAPYLGAYLGYFGWTCWTRGLLLGFVSQGLLVGVGLATRQLTARSRVAHGPAMWLGTVLALFGTIA